MAKVPRVFISYSHDSDAHRARVLALSERLRVDGIETILDQYVNGTPAKGWPRWMLNGLPRRRLRPTRHGYFVQRTQNLTHL